MTMSPITISTLTTLIDQHVLMFVITKWIGIDDRLVDSWAS